MLLLQCFYYRGFTLRDPKPEPKTNAANGDASERTPLINDNADSQANRPNGQTVSSAANGQTDRQRSQSAFRERFASLDGTYLSPASPMHPQPKNLSDTEAAKPSQPRSWTQAIFFNSTAILLVVLAGVAGYYLSPETPPAHHGKTEADEQKDSLHFNLWGQIFGYVCAVLYLGSRVPQLLLNYRRKSTEGLNALFFLFACLGNLTYVLSIFAFEPICSKHHHGHREPSHCRDGEAAAIYGKYIMVNLSWLIGSLGTLFLDLGVFAQFFMYRHNREDAEVIPRTVDGDGRGREPNER